MQRTVDYALLRLQYNTGRPDIGITFKYRFPVLLHMDILMAIEKKLVVKYVRKPLNIYGNFLNFFTS